MSKKNEIEVKMMVIVQTVTLVILTLEVVGYGGVGNDDFSSDSE